MSVKLVRRQLQDASWVREVRVPYDGFELGMPEHAVEAVWHQVYDAAPDDATTAVRKLLKELARYIDTQFIDDDEQKRGAFENMEGAYDDLRRVCPELFEEVSTWSSRQG